MIARVWHGVTHASRAEDYTDYLRRTGVVDSRATEGNRGVVVMRRVEGESAHFLFVSLWDSEEAIRRFAGDQIERARYYPEDASYLLELELDVAHYEVIEGP